MSVKPSARRSSSATYWGAMQIPAIFASRTVVVSGAPSCASELCAPIRPAAPADESVERNWRRVRVVHMMAHLPSLERTSPFQLALELVEKAPVARLGDELIGGELDHARLAQAQCVEAKRVLGIVVTPRVVRNLLQRLQRIVVARGEAAVDDCARGSGGIVAAEVSRLEDRAQHALGRRRMLAHEVAVASEHAAIML